MFVLSLLSFPYSPSLFCAFLSLPSLLSFFMPSGTLCPSSYWAPCVPLSWFTFDIFCLIILTSMQLRDDFECFQFPCESPFPITLHVFWVSKNNCVCTHVRICIQCCTWHGVRGRGSDASTSSLRQCVSCFWCWAIYSRLVFLSTEPSLIGGYI